MIRTLIALFMLSTLPANASFNGEKLASYCKKEQEACNLIVMSFLDGYLFSAVDMTRKLDPATYDTGYEAIRNLSGICMPKGLSLDQIRETVLHHIKNEPKVKNYPSSRLILAAVKEAYPCE